MVQRVSRAAMSTQMSMGNLYISFIYPRRNRCCSAFQNTTIYNLRSINIKTPSSSPRSNYLPSHSKPRPLLSRLLNNLPRSEDLSIEEKHFRLEKINHATTLAFALHDPPLGFLLFPYRYLESSPPTARIEDDPGIYYVRRRKR